MPSPVEIRHTESCSSRSTPPIAPGNLLVFADDWGRHPSSAQHLIARLLLNHDVSWVNTIGMRPPRLDWKTTSRAWEKLRAWSQSAPATINNESPSPTVIEPRMWPWFRHSWDRRLNKHLLKRSLNPALATRSGPVVAVTTLPIVADLVGALPVDRWIYYCVDDFSTWPGLDAKPLRLMEDQLVARVDRVIAVSETLKTRLSRTRDDVALLTHGVDLDHWRDSGDADASLSKYPSPRILFWGLVDQRLDIDFLSALANDLVEGTILLVGPEDNPDPRLEGLPRLQRIPPVPFEQLPALARQADVLIMPYADRPVTRMMQPLKLLEYLASGRPAVVRDLPAVAPWRDCLDAMNTPVEFSRTVRERIATGLPDSQATARGRLINESWSAKARQFEEFIFS